MRAHMCVHARCNSRECTFCVLSLASNLTLSQPAQKFSAAKEFSLQSKLAQDKKHANKREREENEGQRTEENTRESTKEKKNEYLQGLKRSFLQKCEEKLKAKNDEHLKNKVCVSVCVCVCV